MTRKRGDRRQVPASERTVRIDDRQVRKRMEANPKRRVVRQDERQRPADLRSQTPDQEDYYYQRPERLPEKKKTRKKSGCGCFFSAFLFLVILSGAIFGGLWLYQNLFGPPPLSAIPASQRESVAKERAASNVSFLIVGIDHRGDEPSRSDTMIYTVLRPVDNDMSFVSLPRDSLVTIPGNGQDKLNAAYPYGGMELLTETVEDTLGKSVDHHVTVDFQSFEKIIDAMGGITIDVPEKMYFPEENIDLEKGKQKLDGHDALAFVRWRGDGTGDLGRIERQQVFMQAVVKKGQRLMPWQAVRTAWVLQHEIDTDLSLIDSLYLAGRMIGISRDDIHSYHFEVDPQYINRVSYVLLDDDDIEEVMSLMHYGMML